MTDIIRMARAIYGPAYDEMASEAGRTKLEYLAAGGDPSHVISPERLEVLSRHGASALAAEPSQFRDDGSVAGPFVPTPLALAMNMIESRAVPAVEAATLAGINTVSSGVNQHTGKGFAIGRAPDGHVVRLER